MSSTVTVQPSASAARAEPVAHLPVEISQGQAADAALWGPADFGGLHQPVPKALAVDDKILHEMIWFVG